MFKVDRDGKVYEFGRPIVLTEEDRKELRDEITVKCKVIPLGKRRGSWRQQPTKEVIESNFNVEVVPLDFDEDAPTYTEQLEQAVDWKQVMALPFNG
jgi:hypothetical protein